jgi:amino acid transporter
LSEQKKLFLRDATGLVRAWSLYDSFVYSALSINVVSLGWYAFTDAVFFPGGNIITATVVSAIFIFFEILAYTLLIAIMPRAGGDYVWQSRILSGSVGYVLSFTGYVFILWLWGPIYGNIVSILLFSPVAAVLGNASAAIWWYGANGIFASSILTIVIVSIIISLGMKRYARFQKWCFHIGMVGLIATYVILAASSQTSFQAAFNSWTAQIFGASGDSYTAMQTLATGGGLSGLAGLTDWNFGASMAIIPFIAFFNLYPVWGATLYGEVRGSNDFKRNLKALTASLVFTTILAVLGFVLFANAFGWNFWNSANYVYWGGNCPACYNYNPTTPALPFPLFPSPGLFAGIITSNLLVELFLLVTLSFWYWGWSGTLFITSTRVMFAASFDRIFPAKFADVNERLHSPINAIIGMAVPTAIFSYLYAYVSFWGTAFASFTFDAVLVIAVMYFGTAVAAAILPYRRKDLYEGSPIAGYKVGPIPLVTIAGVIMALFMAWLTYMWASNSTYAVNSVSSFLMMVALYVIAIVLYFGFKVYRKKQGFDMGKIYQQIPVE